MLFRSHAALCQEPSPCECWTRKQVVRRQIKDGVLLILDEEAEVISLNPLAPWAMVQTIAFALSPKDIH